jgi:hypothetical protein
MSSPIRVRASTVTDLARLRRRSMHVLSQRMSRPQTGALRLQCSGLSALP